MASDPVRVSDVSLQNLERFDVLSRLSNSAVNRHDRLDLHHRTATITSTDIGSCEGKGNRFNSRYNALTYC